MDDDFKPLDFDLKAVCGAVTDQVARQPLVAPRQIGELLREVIDAEHHAERVIDVPGRVRPRGCRFRSCGCETAHILFSFKKITMNRKPEPTDASRSGWLRFALYKPD